jgi:microcystin-dependent protein
MSEPFLAEIRMFAGNFAPQGWAFCDGSILPIAQNTALFSLLGTTYGGNGQTTFALPDLRGRYAMNAGNGPGLTPRVLGEVSGEENHTLVTAETPAHSHSVGCVVDAGADSGRPNGNLPSVSASTIYASTPADQAMNSSMIGISGGSQPHNNMPPYLCVNFIIALNGIYPARN